MIQRFGQWCGFKYWILSSISIKFQVPYCVHVTELSTLALILSAARNRLVSHLRRLHKKESVDHCHHHHCFGNYHHHYNHLHHHLCRLYKFLFQHLFHKIRIQNQSGKWVEAIHNIKCLTKVDVSNCRLDDRQVNALFLALAPGCTTRDLDIGQTDLSSVPAEILAAAVNSLEKAVLPRLTSAQRDRLLDEVGIKQTRNSDLWPLCIFRQARIPRCSASVFQIVSWRRWENYFLTRWIRCAKVSIFSTNCVSQGWGDHRCPGCRRHWCCWSQFCGDVHKPGVLLRSCRLMTLSILVQL